jgi:BirA family transcriptional regulator, biotin operon repressor / biotin---[acetyl-CoA-carboxylase] ligase
MSEPDWLYELPTCPSTNTWAMDHGADLPHGAVVFTRCQTAGRGQRGRSWVAPVGVFTASFVLRSLPVESLGALSLLAGLAVIQALAQLTPELSPRLQIKWPNDIWLDGRKLAGILSETTQTQNHADRQVMMVVGIGLNRQADFTQTALADQAISLHQVVPVLPSDRELLEQLRSQLLHLAVAAQSSALLRPEWVRAINQRDLLRDRTITLQVGAETIVGVGLGIDWQGGYQLRLPDGTVRSVRSAQILGWA